MKRILVFIFILCGFSSLAQDNYNVEFAKILNSYRQNNNLNPVYVDSSLKSFADSHSAYMANIDEVTHGENEYDFLKRWKKFPKSKYFGGENCTKLLILPKSNTRNVKTSIDEITTVISRISKNGPTVEDVSLYTFLMWKYSPSHNKFLLDPKIKYFYLSITKKNLWYYCEFVSYGDW
jgi:uncharacterized protein YkwD